MKNTENISIDYLSLSRIIKIFIQFQCKTCFASNMKILPQVLQFIGPIEIKEQAKRFASKLIFSTQIFTICKQRCQRAASCRPSTARDQYQSGPDRWKVSCKNKFALFCKKFYPCTSQLEGKCITKKILYEFPAKQEIFLFLR